MKSGPGEILPFPPAGTRGLSRAGSGFGGIILTAKGRQNERQNGQKNKQRKKMVIYFRLWYNL